MGGGCSTCLAAVVGRNVDVGCPQAWCSVYCSNIEAGGDVYSEDDGGDAYLLQRHFLQVHYSFLDRRQLAQKQSEKGENVHPNLAH